MKLAAMAATTAVIIRQMAVAAQRSSDRSGILEKFPLADDVSRWPPQSSWPPFRASRVCTRHRRALRDKIHHNAPLQQAWNLCGEENFEFEILQQVEAADLLHAEQEWIDRTDCTHRKIGFNISALASTQGKKTPLTWQGFRDPSGNPVSIVNLSEFCRRHTLDFSSMHRLAKGVSKLKSYKGWTHQNSVRKRDYVKSYDGFVDPSGKPVPTIRNLAEFCRARGLDCKACNLTVVHMHEVKSGKRPSHKGWTWREHDESQVAQWRRLAEIHEPSDLGNQSVPATTRPQPC